MKQFFCLLLAAVGCTPLTFSNQPAIDFDRYHSVYVSVSLPGGYSGYDSDYLASEMSRDSGFALVTTSPAVTTDLRVEVDAMVNEKQTCDSDGACDTEYLGTGRFRAIDRQGRTILLGTEEDTSRTPAEALSDVLDQVDLRFFRPYRL